MLIAAELRGRISDKNGGIGFASVGIIGTSIGTSANENGEFTLQNLKEGTYTFQFSALGYASKTMELTFAKDEIKQIKVELESEAIESDDVVISGTLSPVSRDKSAVAIEVYRPKFFLKNPTPSLFEALQTVNGVRPQVNCNICNTGDIHMNGLEGPYTMITIDGMPIVSGLATVYGLNGIPNSLIERMEVVKGPASTLYGSEAVGGLINIITKSPHSKPFASVDAFITSWGESNLDVGIGYKTKKIRHLLGINSFIFDQVIDKNGDGFTDAALAKRFSLFHKSAWKTSGGEANLAFRVIAENRWGGQLNFKEEFRGTDSVYGENIETRRIELIGGIPFRISSESFRWQISASAHFQDSWYGTTTFLGRQNIAFSQLLWDKKLSSRHTLLAGAALRYTWYDDNTVATQESIGNNQPSSTWLPGLFAQHNWDINSKHSLLSGIRYDHNSVYGNILTPRINYKWSLNKLTTLRAGLGNGYRIANVFTEDHAALTGARNVIFKEAIKPEKSWNFNTHLLRFVNLKESVLQLEFGGFYTYFYNKIIPDYLSDPNSIIYQNLSGHAVSKGLSANMEWSFKVPLRLQVGMSLMDVYQVDENGDKQRQLLTEQFSSTWTISYSINKLGLSIDYTGNVYSPMLLPLLSEWDPRSPESPWFSIQNLQVTKEFKNNLEVYLGVKNLLDFTPASNSIARAIDPFDKSVQYNPDGSILRTANNPYALSFDPSYVYASNQGRRYFIGLRWNFNK